jgi:large subunit ribosomal protein L23
MKAIYVIISPAVTEKATKLGEKFTYCFLVRPSATKIDVKKAIKEIYGHDVDKVKMMTVPAKRRILRRSEIEKRKVVKKAYITLKGRKKLDPTKIAKEAKK